MAGWHLDETETLRKHRENFRRAVEELTDPSFPMIHLAKKALLSASLEAIERVLESRGQNKP
jgi:hypothetical protein